MSASDFGVLLPKKFWAEKRSFPQRHFATLLQISPDWNKIPWLENGPAYCDHSRTCLPGDVTSSDPQMEKMGPFFHPLKINFFERSYLRSYGALRCNLKISQLEKDDHWPTLANAYLIGRWSVPGAQTIFNTYNSKIGQNLAYFELYRRVTLGELHRFSTWCHNRGGA